MRTSIRNVIFGAAAALVFAGCGADAPMAGDDAIGNGAEGRGGTGVSQSGAQDFGRFRGIIEDGELPAPNTLDPVGFFNEHKIELPAADCGQDVCLHGMLGVQGNMINGNNCTVAMVGFNTPLNPDDFDRPPLNMAVAVDVSGSMQGMPIESVRAGLRAFAEELEPKDTVTLVAYSSEANVLIESTPETDPDRELLQAEIANLTASGETNIYAGLRTALEDVSARAEDDRQNRVILLSDGVATTGITDTGRILNLGQSHAEDGVGITTIGVGSEFDLDLMRTLSETGSGNFYLLEDPGAVEEVFSEEIKTFLVPLAEKITIDFDVAEGYEFRAAYGTRLWEGDAESARIEIPSLFMAGRQSADDIGPGGGRRGGGGVILLELIPTDDVDLADDIGAGAPAGTLKMAYQKPGSDVTEEQEVTITNPLRPGETPEEGEFEQPSVEKAFVALNIYAGFEMAVERANNGAGNAALNVLNPLIASVQTYLDESGESPDPDIQDDLETMQQLTSIIEDTGAREEVGAPPDPWPQD
jgi:Ca-activated chloride channel family protein